MASLIGFAVHTAITPNVRMTADTIIHVLGFFDFNIFLILFLTPDSPNASGLAAGKKRLAEKESKDML